MIRTFRKNDIDSVAEIWLDSNLHAHDFISGQYWKNQFSAVKEMLPQAELYVYEDERTGEIQGFVGLSENYIEGIFVRRSAQSQGIGRQLLDHVKNMKTSLQLRVYQKNTRALKFYQREGFRVESEGIDANTGEKDYLMGWDSL